MNYLQAQCTSHSRNYLFSIHANMHFTKISIISLIPVLPVILNVLLNNITIQSQHIPCKTRKQIDKQCHIETFFEHIFFLKSRIGQFSDSKKSPMTVAERPKIFDVQCIWLRIFVSLEKIFVFKYLQTISFSFYVKYIWEKCYKKFLGCIFCAPIPFKRYQNAC